MPQTGATRYQRFLKSDKAKTKLKAKKGLPKGTNVTKTNFKVKKIVIKEQLKKHGESEALSTRKLNVKELLNRLNHFNVQSRTAALDDLRELITRNPDVLFHNLGQLIQGVSPLLLNIEKKVRQECLKVLHLILSNASQDNVEPFYDFMSTYLRSAMTHIDIRIQEDSLLFLDVLLQTSQRIAQDFHKIIPNFLDMISKLRVDSKPGRTLTVNLDSQITTVKWRVKVLQRLQDFLQKFVEHNNVNKLENTKAMATQMFDDTNFKHYSLFNAECLAVSSMSNSLYNLDGTSMPQDEVQKFQVYIETLIPLLLETWLEVCPNANKEKLTETVVNVDAAVLLKHILEVISLIWDVVQYLNKKHPMSNIQNHFCQKYKQSFTQQIFQSFPYVTNIRMKAKTGTLPFDDKITDPKLVMQNLEICHIFIVLNPHVNFKSQSNEITSLLNYIERIFGQNFSEQVNNVVVKILNTLFANSLSSWTKNFSNMESLFTKIIGAYFNTNISSVFKEHIFALLCQIALNDKLVYYHKNQLFEEWLKRLPEILLEKTVTVQTIDIIHMFAVRSSKQFNEVIKPNLVKVIENLPHITVSNDHNGLGLMKLYSILYWIKSWDNDSLNLIEKQLIENAYNNHGKYIFDTLRLRSGSVY